MENSNLSERNFSYRLDLLRRINKTLYKGKPLAECTIKGNINVWIFFQNRILFNDIKAFVEGQPLRTSAHMNIREIIIGFFSVFISIFALLWSLIRRKDLLIYSVDKSNSRVANNDARIDGLYKAVLKHNVSYIEYFYSLLDKNLIINFFSRSRLAFYDSGLNFIYKLGRMMGIIKEVQFYPEDLDLSLFKEDGEKKFVKNLVDRYIRAIQRAEFKINILEKLLKIIKPKLIWAIDNTRDYHELVVASRLCGVPILAFQHGHFTKYHVGWLTDNAFKGEIPRPNKLYVWSEFWKEELLQLGTYFKEDEIEVVGLNVFPSDMGPNVTKDGKNIGILIPFEIDANKVELREYIGALLDMEDTLIYFKLRTDQDKSRQLELSGLADLEHPRLRIVSDIKDILKKIDVVLGTYSTFLYDMVKYEIPIGLMRTSNDFGEGLVRNGLADTINSPSTVKKDLQSILQTSPSTLLGRKKKLYGESPVLMEETLHKVLKHYNLFP